MTILQRDRYSSPSLPRHLVRRSGLMRLFTSLDACKLCTVIAPAGYGKTTSVALFSSVTNDYAFRWVFLLKPDADFHTFVSKVSKSINSIYPDFSEAFWLQYDQMNLGTQLAPDKAQRFGYMVGELLDDRLTEELVLVLDDYHFVSKDENIKSFVTGLLEGSPPHFRVVITSRMSVDLDLMLLLARQQLLQISIDDLRFSEAETEEFISKQLELKKSEEELDKEFISELYTLTDGWAASLVLAVGRLRLRNITEQRQLLADLSSAKTTINQYLSEQVFEAQTSSVQLFLLATSVLPNFSQELSGLLLEEIAPYQHELPVKIGDQDKSVDDKILNAKEILELLVKMQLLNESDDNPPLYNYHQLLRDFLISKVPQKVRLKLHETCGYYFEQDAPELAAGFFILSENGHKSLACLRRLIDGHPRLSLTRLQDQLQETKRLSLTPIEQKELIYLQAKVEHGLGNIDTSENLIRRHLQQENISENNNLLYLTKLLHLKNLNSQQRFGDLKELAQVLIEELKNSDNTSQIEVQVMLILAMAIAQTPSGPEDALRAMKILNEAWELSKKFGAEELESEVLRVRYFVAQEIDYEQTVQAFKDRETNSKGTSTINRITALQDYAFMQVSLGNFAEAKPRILECLDLSENFSYSSAIHTSQFLLAECLGAEGKFDEAIKNYEQAVVYYLPVSPQISLTILYRMTECAFYKGDIPMAENCTARSNIVYKQHKNEHFDTKLILHLSSFFCALTKKDFKQANDALAKAFYLFPETSREMESRRAELYLLQANLSLLSNADIDSFIITASKYVDLISQAAPEVRHLTLKFHWRLAEAVFRELFSLIDSLEPRQSKALQEFLQKKRHLIARDLLSIVIEQKRSLGIFDTVSEHTIENEAAQTKHTSSPPSKTKKNLIRIQTFGGLKIYSDETEGHKPNIESQPVLTDENLSTSALKATFKILLINHQKPVSTDELFEYVWPNSSSKYHIHMLRNAISRIRKTFITAGLIDREKELISKTESGYILNLGVHGIDYFYDVEEFDYQIHQAQRAYESDLPKKAADHYQKAISIYKGDFLVDDRYEAWVANRQESLKDTYLEALLFLAKFSFSNKRDGEVINVCEQLLKLNPISEEAYEMIIKVHLNRGIYSEARKTFDRCKKAFRKELNTFPPLRIERLVSDERKTEK